MRITIKHKAFCGYKVLNTETDLKAGATLAVLFC